MTISTSKELKVGVDDGFDEPGSGEVHGDDPPAGPPSLPLLHQLPQLAVEAVRCGVRVDSRPTTGGVGQVHVTWVALLSYVKMVADPLPPPVEVVRVPYVTTIIYGKVFIVHPYLLRPVEILQDYDTASDVMKGRYPCLGIDPICRVLDQQPLHSLPHRLLVICRNLLPPDPHEDSFGGVVIEEPDRLSHDGVQGVSRRSPTVVHIQLIPVVATSYVHKPNPSFVLPVQGPALALIFFAAAETHGRVCAGY